MDNSTRFEGFRIAALLSFICTLMHCLPVSAGELQILTEQYPPISFSDNGKASGLGSEVAMEIERRLGSKSTIQVMPWARAYNIALHDSNIALFATMRTEEREKLFKWMGPLTTVKTSFYSLRNAGIRIANLNDARLLSSILVPREYYSQQALEQKGFHNLEPVNTPEMMVRMLMVGRRQVMVADNLTLGTLLGLTGADRKDVVAVYTFLQSQNYIAFSKDTPDDLVQAWQKSLDDMKRDGTFARIYEKWLPGETPPGSTPMSAVELVDR